MNIRKIHKEVNESKKERYELLARKTVNDTDGFSTDYSLYYDTVEDLYVCIFGDSDLYTPDNTDADEVFDTEEAAKEWFDNYDTEDDDSIFAFESLREWAEQTVPLCYYCWSGVKNPAKVVYSNDGKCALCGRYDDDIREVSYQDFNKIYRPLKSKVKPYKEDKSAYNRVANILAEANAEPHKYTLIYDYKDESGKSHCNCQETFEGSWIDLQAHLKQMKNEGRYNIDATRLPVEESCARKLKKDLKEGGYRGCDKVQFVGHGEWADPDLVYNGYTFNYWDIEDALWSDFLDETGHSDKEAENPEVEAEYDEYVRARIEDYLDDCIAGGYFHDGHKSWRRSDWDEESDEEDIAEACEKSDLKEDKNPLENIRSNMLEMPNGEVLYIEYKDGKLVIGDATNTGIIPRFEANYDFDKSVDENIQELYDSVIEQCPEYGVENANESCNKALKESDKKVTFKKIPDDYFDWNYAEEELNNICDDDSGIVVCGNRHLMEFGDSDLIQIIKDEYYEDEDGNEFTDVLDALKAKTGKDYDYRTIRGYSQGDWDYVYYPEDTDEAIISEVELYMFGKYDEYMDPDHCVYNVSHDIAWKGLDTLKKELSYQSGVAVENIRVINDEVTPDEADYDGDESGAEEEVHEQGDSDIEYEVDEQLQIKEDVSEEFTFSRKGTKDDYEVEYSEEDVSDVVVWLENEFPDEFEGYEGGDIQDLLTYGGDFDTEGHLKRVKIPVKFTYIEEEDSSEE